MVAAFQDRAEDAASAVVPARDVADALERVLRSDGFVASAQLSALLRFLVEKHLDGRDDLLKGQTIGTMVLGRPRDFDAQRDPIVRVEANRLRKALASYYAEAGAADPVRIIVEPGGYVPRFEAIALAAPAAPLRSVLRPASAFIPGLIAAAFFGGVLALLLGPLMLLDPDGRQMPPPPTSPAATPTLAEPRLPRIRVENLDAPSANVPPGVLDGLRAEMAAALSRFPELRVAASSSTADFILEGFGALDGGEGSLTVRLIDGAAAQVVWSAILPFGRADLRNPAATERLIGTVAQAVGSARGAVARHLDVGSASTADAYADYRCIMEARSRSDTSSGAASEVCLKGVLARFPNFAGAYVSRSAVMLGRFHAAEDSASAAAALAAAQADAYKALQLEPGSATAMGAMLDAALAAGDIDNARSLGARAVATNPYDPRLRVGYTMALLFSGDLTAAAAEAKRVEEIDLTRRGFYEAVAFLGHLGHEEVSPADVRVIGIDVLDEVCGLMLQVLALDASGDLPQRDAAIAALYRAAPAFARDMPAALRRHFPDTPLAARIEAGLRKAGVGLPDAAR